MSDGKTDSTILPPPPSTPEQLPEVFAIAVRSANLEGLLRYAIADIYSLRAVITPLAAIADAFDANGLDDEARKFWGVNLEHENTAPHEHIELYAGRGGKRLITLADAMRAREVLNSLRIWAMP